MNWRTLAGLLGCGALFGLSYVLVRVTVPSIGPVGVTAVRTLIGGGTLLAVARLRDQPVRVRDWRRYLALGALSAAVPFSLISLSMVSLDAGTAAVLNASSPMFALLIDAVGTRRWPTAAQLSGLASASVGVVVVMAVRGVRVDSGSTVGIVAGLCGAAVFAYAGFFAARRFPATAPLPVAAGQQLAGCALLAPALVVFTPHAHLHPGLVTQLVTLGLLGSALAYLLFYWLIGVEGPTRTANVNLLVPLFGVLWGRLLLGEPIPPWSTAGMVLTLGGLVLILRPRP